MKRLLSCFLILTLALSMAACGTEPPSPTAPPETIAPTEPTPPEPAVELLSVLTGNHYRGEWSADYVTLGWTEWQSLVLDETFAAAYPQLAAALEQWNAGQEADAAEKLEAMLPDAQQLAAERGHAFQGFQASILCRVQRADSRILSVRCDHQGEDGAGAYSWSCALNLDPATGEAVTIDQVITDPSQLPGLLEDALRAKYGDDAPVFEGEISPEAWIRTLNYQGITFFINPGVSETEHRHGLSATLLFADHPGLFEEQFLAAPAGGYAVMLSNTGANDVDLTPGDGRMDQLTVTLQEEGGLWIDLNGQVVGDANIYGYGFDAYLVTADQARFYLYIDAVSDNDYRTLYVYDLSGTEPALVTTLYGEGFAGDMAGNTWCRTMFNDPARFALATRTNLLGTLTGSREYAMDPATGIPQPERNYYTLSADSGPLTSKIDLELELLPSHQTETIPAGMTFRFMRTDNESYVDMLMEDGRECRIQITFDGWMGLVNGIPEAECFDGIMYAG